MNSRKKLSLEEEESPTKMHLPAYRTRSTPLIDSSADIIDAPRVLPIEGPEDILRSSSDPDILLSYSESLDDFDEERNQLPDRNSTIHGSLRDSRNNSQTNLRPVVRFSQNTMESAANAIEDMLSRSQPQPPTSPGHGLAKAIKKAKAKQKEKDEKKLKKAGKTYGSADDIVDDHSAEAQDQGRSSSGSPQENTSPYFPRKPTKSSLFRRKKQQKDKAAKLGLKKSPSPDIRDKEPSPPAANGSDTALFNGHHSSSERTLTPTEHTPGGALAQRSASFSPGHIVSNPRIMPKKEEEEETIHFNLQTLVNPLPEGWVKCGYLWLRMKLPNNRYAWTYIVS